MSLSQSRANSAATNQGYYLRTSVKVQEIPEQRQEHDERKAAGLYASKPNFEVLGDCGHRLGVISGGDLRGRDREVEKIDSGKPRRRRCYYCPKEG